jgi:3-methyladenine DNA glycosylase Tag
MSSFDRIRTIAAERKGGEKALLTLLPEVPSPRRLARIGDNRLLGEMTKRIFCSGFAWSVIEKKWPGFEEAFLGFDPSRLLDQPDDFWEALASDSRIVRNGQKIASVQKNAQFITEIAAEHGSFGRFLAAWPVSDLIGLLQVLANQGARLGGHTGQYFLRFAGKDGFILTANVVQGLKLAGLKVNDKPTRKQLTLVQTQFNTWAEETGLPYTYLSEICARSVGDSCAEGWRADL